MKAEHSRLIPHKSI